MFQLPPRVLFSSVTRVLLSPRLRIPPNIPASAIPDLSTLHPSLDYPKQRFPDTSTSLTSDANAYSENENDPYLSSLPPFPIPDFPSSTTTTTPIPLPHRHTLVVKRTVNMSRKGKIPSFYALVVVGNGDGVIGMGEGKGEEVARAVKKATERAGKAIAPVPRLEGRTVWGEVEVKYKATQVMLRARPAGFGNRANRYIHEICVCAGIRDISGKVQGSRTPMNVVKATIEALLHRQKQPEEIARGRGLRLVQVQKQYLAVG